MNIQKLLEIREHGGAVYSLDYDGEFLYSGSADKFITRWNLETGKQDSFAIRFDDSVYSVKRVEQYLIAGLSSGAVHVFDLNNNKEVKFFSQHQKAIFSIAYSRENRSVVIGDADGNLSVWSSADWTLRIYLPLDCGKIRDVSFNSNEDRMALSCQDGTLRIFDSETFNELQTIKAHEGGTNTSCFMDDHTILSGGKDAYIRLWSINDGNRMEVPAHNFAVYRIRRINSDQFISVSRDKTIKLWNDQLEVLKRLEAKDGGHAHSVNDLCILDQDRFATCSDDKRIIVWNLTNS